jgi:carbamoyltransferase
MKARVNVIKIREQFRPFAGSILQNSVHHYFAVPTQKYYSPFMNYCFSVLPEKRNELAAIVHADNTCRIQTVSAGNNELYHSLISHFYKKTGIPCVLNTSFNLKGEPIVESPKQAIADFVKTKMDALFIGNYMVTKSKKRT